MRGKFLNKLELSYIDGLRWRVEKPLDYMTGIGEIIEVKAWFITDFASIPRIFWRLLPPTGAGKRSAYGPAAVLHDWLYAKQPYERWRCDELLLEAMEAQRVRYIVRYTMYWAVRSFGWACWKNRRKVA